MPRHCRCLIDGAFYHILNRGNAKQQVFFDQLDYSLFLESVSNAKKKHPVDILAYCIMPNHFHFLVRPIQADNLSKWIHLFMTQHIYRHRIKYETTGHIWQGPYKDFIIQDEYHLLIVLRYIEANALRAGLTDASAAWRWSSQFERSRGINYLLNRNVVKLPPNWREIVDTPLSEEDATRLTRSLERQTPFGKDDWIQSTAEEHDLGHTIRPRGRPWNNKN